MHIKFALAKEGNWFIHGETEAGGNHTHTHKCTHRHHQLRSVNSDDYNEKIAKKPMWAQKDISQIAQAWADPKDILANLMLINNPANLSLFFLLYS